ncbi:hypothetical protein [Nocardioides sp. TF02-7]|uniref:hypothetical protein n=1 Tax=Nocardioides sp. TF02-7 TaxID=2917724 RepID=UPI001F064C9B|nr:hypothetical protein [Nocardioides sp. TF02-7]UMG91544.1 hypothetical protein MF408_15705 [Nocardioides sp. TF02-7]
MLLVLLALAGLVGAFLAPAPASADEPAPTAPSPSVFVTWDCTGSPCPWGGQTTGHAVAWPAEVAPVRNRHGYTTSAGVYAPGATTSGYQVSVHTGSARVYAGEPDGAHRLVASVAAGGTTTLPVVAAGEVFSVQADGPFTYTLTPGTPPAPDPDAPRSSAYVTWDCTGTPCPWGGQTAGHAVVWPVELSPVRERHGYTTSAGVYVPAQSVAGFEVSVHTGSAKVYAGEPDGSHRLVASIAAGGTTTLPVVAAGEVFSVQADDPFTYTLAPGTPPDPDPDPEPEPDPAAPRSSAQVTWDCTGSPCPWGAQTSGHAAVWPAEVAPIRNRHGYTTSAGVYAPGQNVAGHRVSVHTGSARVYAGEPDGSHRLVASVPAGGTTTLPAIGAGEVFSVQADDAFTYTLTAGTVPQPDPNAPRSSASVTWDCTGSPCPWGEQTSGHAVVWPAEVAPIRNRHGYTTSAGVYAPRPQRRGLPDQRAHGLGAGLRR